METILKIENASENFGMFLMSMCVPFVFYYGDFYILNTRDMELFSDWCHRKGVPSAQLSKMRFSLAEKEF